MNEQYVEKIRSLEEEKAATYMELLSLQKVHEELEMKEHSDKATKEKLQL